MSLLIKQVNSLQHMLTYTRQTWSNTTWCMFSVPTTARRAACCMEIRKRKGEVKCRLVHQLFKDTVHAKIIAANQPCSPGPHSSGFVWGDDGDGGSGCSEGTQHLSGLRHNLQMAAVSGETSAPEPVERRGDRGGRQTLRRKSRRTERWREMETGLTECEVLRWKRERRGVVKKIGWVNLGEPGDIPSIFFYVPSRVIAHFLSRGLKAIQVSVCCCQSKRAELPLKSMLMQNVVEKASPNDICCCVIYWWSLWRIHYFSNSRQMKMSEVGLLLVNYLNGSCLSCLCSFIMNV